jgi:hypothetical protein
MRCDKERAQISLISACFGGESFPLHFSRIFWPLGHVNAREIPLNTHGEKQSGRKLCSFSSALHFLLFWVRQVLVAFGDNSILFCFPGTF